MLAMSTYLRPMLKVRRFVTPQGCSVTSVRRLNMNSVRIDEEVILESSLELVEAGRDWPQPNGSQPHVW